MTQELTEEQELELLVSLAQYIPRFPGQKLDTRNSCRPPGYDQSMGVEARRMIRNAQHAPTKHDTLRLGKAAAKRERKNSNRLENS